MASVGIRFEGNHFLRFLENNKPVSSTVKICNDMINVPRIRISSTRVSSSMSMKSSSPSGIVIKTADSNKKAAAAVFHEKIDKWMRDSVVEIVKNLREAPLLVHVLEEEGGETTMLKTEKGVQEETWPGLVDKWEKRETQLPDGVIFVEKLEEDCDQEQEDVTRAWGIVVQGRGGDCGPVCYLLKTSRVGAGPGLGLCCTHFCLMRVKSFRETARAQLKSCWLLQGQ